MYLNNIKEMNEPYVVVIGNFDGVHRGHQFLLKQATSLANLLGCKVVAVTFYPHPKIIFGQQGKFYIYGQYMNRQLLLEHCDAVYEITFNRQCAELSPEEFLDTYLYSANLKGIVIGYDFLFGRGQRGDATFIHGYCNKHSLLFHQVGAFAINQYRLSSSLVRNFLLQQLFSMVDFLLGRKYYLQGKLKTGKGIGRKIESPTLNLEVERSQLLPPNGVYASYTVVQGKEYPSVTNIGFNPTIENNNDLKIETHILDQTLPFYSTAIDISVHFIKFLREEQQFSSIELLQQQIGVDIQQAKEVLCL